MKQNIVFLGKRFFVMICIAGMVVGFSACEKPNNKGPRETGTGGTGGWTNDGTNGGTSGNTGGNIGGNTGGGTSTTEETGYIRFSTGNAGIFYVDVNASVTLQGKSGTYTQKTTTNNWTIHFELIPVGQYNYNCTITYYHYDRVKQERIGPITKSSSGTLTCRPNIVNWYNYPY